MRNTQAIQTVNHFQGRQEYEQLENLIEDKAGVRCTVIVKPHCIILRTKDYTEYVLARSVIRQRVTKPIQRDLKDLVNPEPSEQTTVSGQMESI